jgi:hypothetical protein
MTNHISSGLLDYFPALDPMIVFIIVIVIVIAATEKFVVRTVNSSFKIGIAGLNPTQGVGTRLHVFEYIVLGRTCGGQVPSFRNPTKCVENKFVVPENYSELLHCRWPKL